MIVKLLTKLHLEFLSLTEDCRGSSESTVVKMSNCWKYHAAAQIFFCIPHLGTFLDISNKICHNLRGLYGYWHN